MPHATRWSLVLLLAGLLATAGCDSASVPTALDRGDTSFEPAVSKAGSDVIPEQYIVVFKETVKNPRALAAQLAAENGAEVLHAYEFALPGMAIKAPAAAAEALRRNPNVSYVEADAMAYPTLITQSPATWGIDRVDQRNRPLSNSYSYDYTGQGVRVYVIDSGIDYSHPQFEGRAFNSKDFVNDGNTDCNSHGTHVAGTIGSKTYGIAKKVDLYSVRVFPCSGGASYTTIIAAVDHVTAEKLANPGIPMAANMSLGGGVSSSLNNAVTNSISKGVVYAVSAGNDNTDACTKSPASTPAALTVGSTTSSDARSSFSNFGTCVDLFGPGSSILSTIPGGGTGTKSGTSMSSPHVAGVAALVLQAQPGATAAQVNAAIVDNATTGVLSSIGTGSPNRLLYSLIGGGSPPPPNVAPTADFTWSATGLTVSFTDESTDSDGSIVGWSWNFGDGSTSTAQNPSRIYAAAGTYTVTLVATDNAGATGTTSQNVTVTNLAPTASFIYSASGLTATFTDASSDSDGSVVGWSWDFGDGTTSTARNPAHTYAAEGTFTVTLTVTDNAGATSDTAQDVTVTAPVLVSVSRIDLQVTKVGKKYVAEAKAYAANGEVITGDFYLKGRYVSSATATVSELFATLTSNQTPAKTTDVFSITLNGASGVTSCEVSVLQATATCQ